ncbi:hypothetical protein D0Z07_0085 [Hyphodiscus hymeniophilus]|uniref:Calpain catalytic domain-containing protein n=1 Tax=Hyphodiscus hymeniophilus TaxID=353542 RepID=A0A9P6VQQ8_9HELO|nr:hypothetical protein D0Z07_0085 [Hyphodiscus hymeniophilus]
MLSYIKAKGGARGGLKKDDARPSSTTSGSDDLSRDEDLNKNKDAPYIVMAPAPPRKVKHQSPQAAIDEFWEKFDSKTPGRGKSLLFACSVTEAVPKGTIKGENAVASYEEAVAICKDKVAKIVRECKRVNQKYRDPHFDIEFDLKWGVRDCLTMLGDTTEVDSGFRPGSVKRVGDIFDNPKFYISGATANDIRQGRDGDCWFMAALCTLGNKPGLIDKVCVARNEEVGVYGFVFHRDGEWRSEIIDDKLYLTKPDYDESWIERNLIEDRQRINSEEDYRKIYQSNSGALFFAQCEDPNETWLPLLEKAYAKAHGDYAAIEGGFTGEGLEDLTGGVTTEIFSTDILDKEYFWKEELLKVNKDFLFGCAAGIFWGRGYRKGIYEGHAYSIMKAVEIDGKRLCLLRNPWGEGEWTGAWSDGSKEWTPEWMQKLDHRFGDDGAFWMSYEDLLKKYQTFDRTRLFDEEWKVTQQWTSLTVPWTVDYQDTKFNFTLKKKAPVVIVLSQLDGRYFSGLEGQYSFKLSFRVHKAGEEDYIVRSHGNYWMRRSVTAELELEPGEYHVLMKVEAIKSDGCLPVEDVVRNNAKERRDKLLRIGLAYDLAHAKGQLSETDEEKKARKKAESKKKTKEKKDMKDKLMKEKRKRKHNENKETFKQRAAAAKRKAKAKAQEEKKKAAKEQENTDKKDAKDIKGDLKDTDQTTETPKKDGEPDAKTEEPQTVSAASKDPTVEKVTQAIPAAEEPVAPAPAPKEEVSRPAADPLPSAEKPKDTAPVQTTLAGLPGLRINGISAPSSVAGFDDFDEDDLSDLNSNVSDITSGVVEDEIAAAKLAAEAALPPILPPDDDEEDEFERDPWNAVAVVGLRVYSKESGVSVKVVRPRLSEEVDKDEKAEVKLDIDDSNVDAVKDGDDKKNDPEKEQTESLKKKDEVKPEDGEKKQVDGSQKAELETEGSVVMV